MNIGDILNQYAEKQFLFSALKNPLCSAAEILQTIIELKEVPFYQRDNVGVSQKKIQQLTNQAVEYCVRMLTERELSLPDTSTDELNHYFLRALLALQQGLYREALRNLLIYNSYSEVIFPSYPHLYYYRGLAWYGLQEYVRAAEDFSSYLAACPQDEIAHFYRGNALFLGRRFQEAVDDYIIALQQHACFPEVMANAAILEQSLTGENIILQNDARWQDSPFEQTLVLPNSLDIWSIPIFINNFNRLECLQRLLEWLKEAGYRNIYVLDNDSSYPPLLDYYRQLDEKKSVAHVIRLEKNWGHTALWDSGILERMAVESPYVYTDSDVVPVDSCPKDVLWQMMTVLQRYPLLKKVGLGLKTEGITCRNATEIIAQEKRYYMHKMEENLYFGAVDTTFALYRNYRHYHLYVSARTTGDLMAWHLPWHYDYNNLTPDEVYYARHANASASLVASLKKSGT